MIGVDIPGGATLRLEHLVLDFNGTLACDGVLLAGVRERLERLSASIRIHVVTADTFGRARAELAGLPCQLSILDAHGQSRAKLEYVQRLGAPRTVCIGNGRNDELMIDAAALGIAVVPSPPTPVPLRGRGEPSSSFSCTAGEGQDEGRGRRGESVPLTAIRR
jgi:soluble P-type ATPase